MNIGKNGPSFSVGGKGASVSFGEKGTYLNTSIPGTGLRNRQKIGGKDGVECESTTQYIDDELTKRRGCMSKGWLLVTWLILIFIVIHIFIYDTLWGILFLIVVLGLTVLVLININKEKKQEINEQITEIENTADSTINISNNKTQTKQSITYKSNQDDSKQEFDGKTHKYSEKIKETVDNEEAANEIDSMFEDVAHFVVSTGCVSLSGIQRKFQIGYYRCGRIMDQLEKFGIVGTCSSNQARELIVSDEQTLNHILIEIRKTSRCNESIQNDLQQKFDGLMSEYSKKIKEIVDNSDSDIELDILFEEAARYIVFTGCASSSTLQRKFIIGYTRSGRIMDQLERFGFVGPFNGSKPREIIVSNEHALNCMLAEIRKLPQYIKEKKKKEIEDFLTNKDTKPLSFNKLDALIGLESVKNEVKSLASFIVIKQKREAQGLKSSPISYHCVFTGNPGTGKTTVARIVASIYKKLGILKKGHLVETDRSGLVAEYVGQTAVKTNKIIDSALDGVLFIDEAYSLASGGEHDFGREAISTLLKRMEDDRDRLIVILAGYTDDMKNFIDTNPGLQSRFNRYIDFPDYSEEELFQIFKNNCKQYDYHINPEAESKLKEYLYIAVKQKDKNFGNARFVRNLFEKTIEKQASRLSRDSDITDDELTEILSEDIPDVSSN